MSIMSGDFHTGDWPLFVFVFFSAENRIGSSRLLCEDHNRLRTQEKIDFIFYRVRVRRTNRKK